MDERLRLAEAVRRACVEAALEAYEDAQIRGLCHEGAWECAVGAVSQVDIRRIVAELAEPGAKPSDQ